MSRVDSLILDKRELPMITETLTKSTTPPRSPSLAVRAESPPKKPNYESGRLPQPIEYPESDGQPMAETDFQFYPLAYAVLSLAYRFRDRPDVYVAGNIFFYFVKGSPSDNVSPDVFVVIGAEKKKRRTYKLWEEPKAPDFILEITSSSTRTNDQGSKLGLYQMLGVTEYFCYDPTGDYLDPPLVGYRLENGQYVSIPAQESTSEKVVVRSAVLGLDLRAMKDDFHFVDPVTGEPLRNLDESESDRLEEQRQRLEEMRLRQEEVARRIAAEERIRELEAQLNAKQANGSK